MTDSVPLSVFLSEIIVMLENETIIRAVPYHIICED